MIPNLRRRVSRREAADYRSGFIEEITVEEEELTGRNPRLERQIAVFWVVIAVKCVLVWWLIQHFHIPFSPWWVVAPTLIFAVVLSAVYWWRD